MSLIIPQYFDTFEIYEEPQISFKMADLQPELSTFSARMKNFVQTTNPTNLLWSNKQILEEHRYL